LLVPSLVTFSDYCFWYRFTYDTGDDTTAKAVNDNVATALFVFLEDYPFAFYLNIIAIILIAGFFITLQIQDL
jgi:choline/glycine/proline betaine transport protein